MSMVCFDNKAVFSRIVFIITIKKTLEPLYFLILFSFFKEIKESGINV